MAHIEACVICPLGKFEGSLESESASFQEAVDAVALLCENVNAIDRMAITHTNGSKTIFNKEILKQSVLTLRAVE